MRRALREALKKPILPGQGAGGIELGADKQATLQKLGVNQVSGRQRVDGEVLEYLESNGLTIVFLSGLVETIILESGYCGSTSAGIYVGMPWKELETTFPDVQFVHGLECWIVPSLPNLEVTICSPLEHYSPSDPEYLAEEKEEVMQPDTAFVQRLSVTRNLQDDVSVQLPWSESNSS